MMGKSNSSTSLRKLICNILIAPYTSGIGLLNLSHSQLLHTAPVGLSLMNLARLVLGLLSVNILRV